MRWVAALFVLVMFSHSAIAATARDPGGGGDARLQGLVQQLTAENANLSQTKAQLTGEVETLEERVAELEEELKSAKRDLRNQGGELTNTKAQSDAYQNQNDQLRERLEELVGRYRDLAELLKGVEQERTLLVDMTNDYEERVLICEQNNEGLHTIAVELIERYEKKGFLRFSAGKGADHSTTPRGS